MNYYNQLLISVGMKYFDPSFVLKHNRLLTNYNTFLFSMTSLQTKQAHFSLKQRYRISLNYPNHKKPNHKKLQISQTLNNSYSSSSNKPGRSLQPPQSGLPSETNLLKTVTSPPKKDSLLKMTSLYKFVRQGTANTREMNPGGIKFRQAVEKQIQRDCLVYLEKSSTKNQHRTILHKKLNQLSCPSQQEFEFQRSNTF